MSGVRWQGGKGGRIVRWHSWRGGKVVRWQFGKNGGGGGRGGVRWQGGKDGSGEVARWEIPCFIQGWGTQVETQISSFCF